MCATKLRHTPWPESIRDYDNIQYGRKNVNFLWVIFAEFIDKIRPCGAPNAKNSQNARGWRR